MDGMTAEQAAEAAKGLTFEKVWAVIIETQKSTQDMRESLQKSTQDMQKSVQETQNVMRETQRETNKSFKKMEKTVTALSKNTRCASGSA